MGDCVFVLLEPCLQHLSDTLKGHVQNVRTGWDMLRKVLCGFLDKKDKPDIEGWAREMELGVVMYLNHIESAQVGGVWTYSHAYRTFTSHLVEHLAKYCVQWGDVYEWWCFVFERFAGVLSKKLVGYNKNRSVDAHLGTCLSMEAAIWRHLSLGEGTVCGADQHGFTNFDCTAEWRLARGEDVVGIGLPVGAVWEWLFADLGLLHGCGSGYLADLRLLHGYGSDI